ncbi:MAG TPA: hypothetical protein VN903_16005 [Polyangia bacterium]|jgi:hypothetical protein|nr:hypothetical protein [Polyangia bacterium]
MRNAIKMFGLVSVLALSACGGSGDRNGEAFGRFVGTWQETSGTTTEVCPGYPASTYQATGSMTWNRGVSSDLVTIDPSLGCPIMADVSGATATGVSAPCTFAIDGGSATVTWTAYTFVISPDGHTATENASGSFTYVVDGATIPCTFNGTGSYQKIGN